MSGPISASGPLLQLLWRSGLVAYGGEADVARPCKSVAFDPKRTVRPFETNNKRAAEEKGAGGSATKLVVKASPQDLNLEIAHCVV